MSASPKSRLVLLVGLAAGLAGFVIWDVGRGRSEAPPTAAAPPGTHAAPMPTPEPEVAPIVPEVAGQEAETTPPTYMGSGDM